MGKCETCGADWKAGKWTAICAECYGGALTRACPFCADAGREPCGEIWKRSVLDSNDYGMGVWAGRCKKEQAA